MAALQEYRGDTAKAPITRSEVTAVGTDRITDSSRGHSGNRAVMRQPFTQTMTPVMAPLPPNRPRQGRLSFHGYRCDLPEPSTGRLHQSGAGERLRVPPATTELRRPIGECFDACCVTCVIVPRSRRGIVFNVAVELLIEGSVLRARKTPRQDGFGRADRLRDGQRF